MPDTKPLVSIACITYNQEIYIQQCLDGFIMQKTNFKYEIVIHDDASTDNTQNIIRSYCEKYPDLFVPILQKENKYREGKGILIPYVYPHCKGKYIALCEGDDYWIDPMKLQKQVDFLEQNPNYGMVHTAAKKFINTTNQICNINIGENFNDIDQLLLANRIITLTTCFRADLCIKYVQDSVFHEKKWNMGDYPMWLYMAHYSKIHFINEVTGIYRVLDESASHSNQLSKRIFFILSSYDISAFYIEKFSKNHLLKSIKRHTLYSIMCAYIEYNQSFPITKYSYIYKIELWDFKIILVLILSLFEFGRKLLLYYWKHK